MTSATAEPQSSPPPAWPYCGYGATTENPVGCHGVLVAGHTACLAHLTATDRTNYLTRLTPGAAIDHRGTPFSEDLLAQLLVGLRDPVTGHPRLGPARFDGATFTNAAWFEEATFSNVSFRVATFTGTAGFTRATFTGEAEFDWVTFSDAASFGRANFTGDAGFRMATFSGPVQFPGATFTGNATFSGARFKSAPWLGPMACGSRVRLDLAVFDAPVTMAIAARELSLQRTRWASAAALRLRYAKVDLTGAVMEYPVTVTAEPVPFTGLEEDMLSEEVLASQDPDVKVTSLSGVDAAHLALTDMDLSECRFAGAVHLDQLHMDGRTTFAHPPIGWHRHGLVPLRWSRRRTLAEEHHWRAHRASQPTPLPARPPSLRNWRPGPYHPDPDRTPDPEDAAALYRQLRKAFEDGKNEPGAADFYYGEMEMRRHDRGGTAPGERRLLWGYWLLSGYGLRASRALGWLAAAMIVTIVLLMGFGLPKDSPRLQATGTVPRDGGKVTFKIDKADPQNPTGERFTSERFEKALNVTLNSVVFRSSGQDLTTAGTYIEMASRVTEPVLLGLAVLAIRNRVKR
ncbi:pentapeptide repeat-containing protein [Streptomyces sp. NPDC006551]|uniref:pentapeptide repeat-containing protein n=1 Tax=Streptomyces sp. NPDC006551 TaxID=3157178 RepID=UPI0033B5A377